MIKAKSASGKVHYVRMMAAGESCWTAICSAGIDAMGLWANEDNGPSVTCKRCLAAKKRIEAKIVGTIHDAPKGDEES